MRKMLFSSFSHTSPGYLPLSIWSISHWRSFPLPQLTELMPNSPPRLPPSRFMSSAPARSPRTPKIRSCTLSALRGRGGPPSGNDHEAPESPRRRGARYRVGGASGPKRRHLSAGPSGALGARRPAASPEAVLPPHLPDSPFLSRPAARALPRLAALAFAHPPPPQIPPPPRVALCALVVPAPLPRPEPRPVHSPRHCPLPLVPSPKFPLPWWPGVSRTRAPLRAGVPGARRRQLPRGLLRDPHSLPQEYSSAPGPRQLATIRWAPRAPRGRERASLSEERSLVAGDPRAPSFSWSRRPAGESGGGEGAGQREGSRSAGTEAAERRARSGRNLERLLFHQQPGSREPEAEVSLSPSEGGAGEAAPGVRNRPPRFSLPPGVGPFDGPASATPGPRRPRYPTRSRAWPPRARAGPTHGRWGRGSARPRVDGTGVAAPSRGVRPAGADAGVPCAALEMDPETSGLAPGSRWCPPRSRAPSRPKSYLAADAELRAAASPKFKQ